MDYRGDNRVLKARAEELMGEFNRMRTGMGELQQKLRQITATAKSDDGYVTAVVGPRGQLVRLELDPRIYRRPDSKQLATTISDTIKRAAADAMAQVSEACKPFIPEEELQAHLQFDVDGMRRRLDSELEFLNLERP
ncbi:MAG TPA: YbaB/EbfC family nucleoid-associated protein [Rugosimonospora sp.]